MSYKIQTVEGIGPAFGQTLAKAGITTTAQLLKVCATAKGRAETSEKTGLKTEQLLKWANLADLMCIKGVGAQFSELLEAAGVDTVKELRTRVAANLHAKMLEVNTAARKVRRAPTLAEVQAWVAEAKGLDPVISH